MHVSTKAAAAASISKHLQSLQSAPLKRLAFLTGQVSTGTKAELRDTLTKALPESRLRRVAPSLQHVQKKDVTAASGNDSVVPNARILSVDMGVKNLAFCLLEVRTDVWWKSESHSVAEPAIKLLEWKRLDLSTKEGSLSSVKESTLSAQDVNADDSALPKSKTKQQYTPSYLSKIAYQLVSQFLAYSPDTILIERQRFRSGGGPAIQEWTVRVNMLEAMLWASLETMSHTRTSTATKCITKHHEEPSSFSDVVEVQPRRVGSFWLEGALEKASISAISASSLSSLLDDSATAKTKLEESDSPSAKPKTSLEKKDKIALARHWLRDNSSDLAIDDCLKPLSAAFCRRGRASASPNSSASPLKDEKNKDVHALSADRPGKLDDLADCLVQGVTYAIWEENRRRVFEYCSSV